MIRAILFDLNGTLVERASESVHLGQLLPDCARSCGWDVDIAHEFAQSLPVSSFRRFLEVRGVSWLSVHRWVADRFDPAQWKLAPQADEILQVLSSRYRLGIVSNSVERFVQKIMRYTKWERIVQYVGTREYAMKPDEAAFSKSLCMLDVTADEAVSVGDSICKDIEPMRKLGGHGIKVEWGNLNQLPYLISNRRSNVSAQ